MRISYFFIDRPVFAIVISAVIFIAGALSLLQPACQRISEHYATRCGGEGPPIQVLPRRWSRRSSPSRLRRT